MLATVHSRTSFGMQAPPVTIDVHTSSGLPCLTVVGLAEGAVRESKVRVRSALITSGFHWPPGRVTINLSPADLPKEGGRYDLPIALGILAATGQLPAATLILNEFYGDLSLAGELRAVRPRRALRRLPGGARAPHRHPPARQSEEARRVSGA